jgi:tetratricopeptide (TPR) repeat protein
MKLALKLLILGMCCSSLWAAPFRHVSSLINIPVAGEFMPGDIEYGTAIAMDKEKQYDFDYMINYSPTERFKFGMTYLHEHAIVLNIHTTFYRHKNLGIATGLRNIKSKESVSSRAEYPDTHHNTYAPYITSYLALGPFKLHFGLGGEGFETVGIEENQTPFGGLEVEILGTHYMIEHDGKDLNTGFKFITGPNTDFSLAYTALTKGDTNEEYNDAPTQQFAFAFNIRHNRKTAYYKKVAEVNRVEKKLRLRSKELDTLKLEYASEIEKLKLTRSMLEADVRRLSDDVSKAIDLKMKPNKDDYQEKKDVLVMDLYSKSFDAYSNGDYRKGLEYISKAVRIEPHSAMLYMRMGSIYYKMDEFEFALESWETAKQLDPDNSTIDKLIQSVK